jgi:hypothetical protein
MFAICDVMSRAEPPERDQGNYEEGRRTFRISDGRADTMPSLTVGLLPYD